MRLREGAQGFGFRGQVCDSVLELEPTCDDALAYLQENSLRLAGRRFDSRWAANTRTHAHMHTHTHLHTCSRDDSFGFSEFSDFFDTLETLQEQPAERDAAAQLSSYLDGMLQQRGNQTQ